MTTFDYRRRLERPELLMLAGGAAGAGAAVATGLFYLGRIWMQRVRLKPKQAAPAKPTGPGPDPALRALAESIAHKERADR
jgi:hypothetical protein